MGTEPTATVKPGTAVAMPTGGALPPGADAVVMIEYTAEAMPGTIEVVRPVAPGEGVVRADEDARVGQQIIPNGRVLRPQDLGMLAAAGVTSVRVHARPVVTIFSTGDEVVPPQTETLRPGQVRDATAAALAALVTDAGGVPVHGGIVPDDPGTLEKALRAALGTSDMLVISAGSSVGARDETATVVARLGQPGIWCHGLAIKPGKPTLLAECARRPGDRAPRQPALGARGVPADRDGPGPPARRLHGPAPGSLDPGEAGAEPRLLHRAAGRDPGDGASGGRRRPLFGVSALLSVLTAADGYVVIPEEATGLDAGTEVDVTLYR